MKIIDSDSEGSKHDPASPKKTAPQLAEPIQLTSTPQKSK